jgi:hypothetical protein
LNPITNHRNTVKSSRSHRSIVSGFSFFWRESLFLAGKVSTSLCNPNTDHCRVFKIAPFYCFRFQFVFGGKKRPPLESNHQSLQKKVKSSRLFPVVFHCFRFQIVFWREKVSTSRIRSQQLSKVFRAEPFHCFRSEFESRQNFSNAERLRD